MLYRLSYWSGVTVYHPFRTLAGLEPATSVSLVRAAGLEPAISPSEGKRSILKRARKLVEDAGLEPASASLQGWCRTFATYPPFGARPAS